MVGIIRMCPDFIIFLPFFWRSSRSLPFIVGEERKKERTQDPVEILLHILRQFPAQFLVVVPSSPTWLFLPPTLRSVDELGLGRIMGIFRKIAGLFGFGSKDEEEREEEDPNRGVADFRPTGLPRTGFSVPVERSNPGPVLVPSNSGDGGVQVSHPLYWKLWHVRLPGASPSQYSCLLPAELKVHCLTFTSYTCINSMPYWSIPELLYLLRSWWRIFTCIGELELCSYAMVLIHRVWSKFWVLSLVDGILELALAMCALHDMLLISRMKAFPSEARFKFLRKIHEFVFLVI